MIYSRIGSQKTNLPTTCTATITKALLKLIIKLILINKHKKTRYYPPGKIKPNREA